MEDSLEKSSDRLHSVEREGSGWALGMLDDLIKRELEDGSMMINDTGLSEQLQDGLQSLWMEGCLTDVTLHVQGQSFPCHRTVLAAASLYFRAMFCNDLREKHEESVNIKGISAEYMKILLDYTYTSKVHITKDNVQKILEAASLFQFQRVVNACASFLAEALCPDNCVGILRLADTHSLVALKEHVHNYILQNFSQVAVHDEVLELPPDVLVSLLQQDDLSVTEEEQVFDVVIRWVRAHEMDRVSLLPLVLTHVRLPLLDPWYFVEKVEVDPLIRGCADVFPLLQEARAYHLSGSEVISERTKPRVQEFQSEVFMIIGGCTKDEKFVSEVTCLDPLRRSRLEVAKLPNTEMESESDNKKWVEFACVTFRNEVYLSGGKETQHDAWKYNASLNKWIQIEYMNTARWRHKMAVLGGKVYAIGGFDGIQRLKCVEAYDPFHNCWTKVTPLLLSVSSFSATSYGRCIYVIGGGAMKALFSYSPDKDTWTMVTTLGCERASCGIAACSNKLFITGGRDDKNEVIATVLCWDPQAKRLTEECVLPRGVSHHGSVTLRKSYTHIRKISPGVVTG